MRRYHSILILLSFSLVCSTWAQTPPPNIVVILADDLGYNDVGFNGCPDIPTPNIDSIAANGALCTDGYATHPFCSPSRAGLITGRYQQRFGHDSGPTLGSTNPRLGLPATELTLPQLLKPAGYVSGAIGKWHLGYVPEFYPTRRGFDEFFGFLDAGSPYYNAELLRNETPLIEQEYLTDAFTREGVSFINRHATQPFFLYLAYNAVHKPYNTPPDIYLERVAYIPDPNRRTYAAMVVALDDGVGQVLQTLQANNLLENTLIFFLSDNGAPEEAADSENGSNNYPLRGYKTNTLEGGIRVPFAVQWTGHVPTHVVYNDLVSALDIVATSTAVAGVPLPTDRVYDGLNILPYLAAEQISPVRTLFWRWFGLGPDGPPNSLSTIWAVRRGPLKLVLEKARTELPPALYNLVDDIGETKDLAAAQPADVASLTQRYAHWTLDTVPPLWEKNSDDEFVPLVLAGDWNGFNINDPNLPWSLTQVSAPDLQGTPDGFNWFTNAIHVAVAGGDTTPGAHSFALVGAGSYSNQWGGVDIKVDDETDIPFFKGSNLGPTNTISLQEGYYSFRIIDQFNQVGAGMKVAVMKTSAPPVTVSRSGQTPVNPNPRDPIIVSISTSQPKSAEERIYLRWSSDLFITSHLVAAEGAGVSYSATIPPQPPETLVQYTVVSSTADLTGFSASGAIDALILSTTNIFNAIPPVLPSITTQPSDKTVTAGQTAKFKIKATGTKPLGYQWKKNGEIISGATKPSYTTPPTTLADNGAVFSVIINNRAGSVVSDNATLTVQ
jgi:arylsulfatase A-like enzyme